MIGRSEVGPYASETLRRSLHASRPRLVRFTVDRDVLVRAACVPVPAYAESVVVTHRATGLNRLRNMSRITSRSAWLFTTRPGETTEMAHQKPCHRAFVRL